MRNSHVLTFASVNALSTSLFTNTNNNQIKERLSVRLTEFFRQEYELIKRGKQHETVFPMCAETLTPAESLEQDLNEILKQFEQTDNGHHPGGHAIPQISSVGKSKTPFFGFCFLLCF